MEYVERRGNNQGRDNNRKYTIFIILLIPLILSVLIMTIIKKGERQ